jgi:putative ABC transport system permease protein
MKEAGAPDEKIVETFNQYAAAQEETSTYEENLKLLGVVDLDNPSSIMIYPTSFDNKEAIVQYIEDYNESFGEDYKITYTDYVGLLMSSVSTVINAISYVLIAFVSISLVVSSIMIGIITYISVLERTKEIGILRSIGASKRDISRVFNAETLIIGFVAGALGILVTLLLCIPANAIIFRLTDIRNVALLPFAGAVVLVVISMLLSLIAGLIPSRVAAKKDPVVALRTE